MLKNIDPVLSADLLHLLASMGHGDDLALVDGNHPAETIARATRSGRLIRLPGLAMERVARAILSVLPIDDFEPDPIRRMEVVGKPADVPEVQRRVQAEIDRALGRPSPATGIERFAFYEAAKAGFGVVQVGRSPPLRMLSFPQGRHCGRAGLNRLENKGLTHFARNPALSIHPRETTGSGKTMRNFLAISIVALGALASAPGTASAQTPPSASEVAAYTGLHAAAHKGDVGAIAKLIAAGASVDARDGNDRTPLHVATFARKHEAMRALAKGGANPRALDRRLYDPITIAAVADDVQR